MDRTARRAFLHRFEVGDAILGLYVAVIARQFLAWIPLPDAFSWFVATLIALSFLWTYVAAKSEKREPTSLAFWLLVAVPLTFVYLLRVAFPDVSFDVLNYRLFHGVRGLHGFLYRPGDFFPTPAPYNTAPDMAMGVMRILFGYRLGTIINLFTLLWAAQITERLLRGHIANSWLRHFAMLLIFLAEHLFFEINTYMIDLLAVPLLLEATRLALGDLGLPGGSKVMIRIAFLLGLSVAFKLINVVTAVPIALLAAWRFLREPGTVTSPKRVARVAGASLAAFLVPVLPFTIYLYQEMTSPVFPIFNGFFKSPYWPPNSGWDNRWGPFGFWEVITWPIRIFFRPDRLSELLVYSGRLSLGFVASFVAWIVAWRDPNLRRLGFVTIAGLLLWSTGTGYIRYALFLEVSAGLVLVMLAVDALKRPWLFPLGLVVAGSLGAQTLLACRYTRKTEWSGRATLFKYPAAWKREAHYFFRDRALRSFSPQVDRARFAHVDVWIESSIKTASLEILLNDKAPVIGLRSYESFASPESRGRFVAAIEAAAGKRIFSLCFVEDLADAIATIEKRGLIAGAQTEVNLPFYSPDYRLGLILIEVTGAEQSAAIARKTL
ncbi:MAG TPA: hypothetical protein VJS88_02130 [Chthoniobacterales bacterium]|nr:hypothetical protein [Chthoniobacterales bacterium]